MDNETMDRRIVEAIKAGLTQFCVIVARTGAENFRQVDRRLQALRKKDVLKYSRKDGWRLI